MLLGHLTLTAILLLCALAFWFAGTRPLLNTMDYRTLHDAPGFNRYVAARLLVPAAVAAVSAVLTYLNPALGVPLIFAIPLSVVGLVIWIGVGSRQFVMGADGREKSAA